MNGIYRELLALGSGTVTGILLMVLYDLLRLYRLAVPHKNLWTGLEDFLYWLISGLVCFMLLGSRNNGEMRIYIIASVFIGMVFYDRTAGRGLFALLKKAGRCFKIKKK